MIKFNYERLIAPGMELSINTMVVKQKWEETYARIAQYLPYDQSYWNEVVVVIWDSASLKAFSALCDIDVVPMAAMTVGFMMKPTLIVAIDELAAMAELSPKDAAALIFHEMVHRDQLVEERMVYFSRVKTREYAVLFEGVEYSLPTTSLEYFESPWEVEAYKSQAAFVASIHDGINADQAYDIYRNAACGGR